MVQLGTALCNVGLAGRTLVSILEPERPQTITSRMPDTPEIGVTDDVCRTVPFRAVMPVTDSKTELWQAIQCRWMTVLLALDSRFVGTAFSRLVRWSLRRKTLRSCRCIASKIGKQIAAKTTVSAYNLRTSPAPALRLIGLGSLPESTLRLAVRTAWLGNGGS